MHGGLSPARKLTYQDFVKFPDDRQRHELIDGVHYVTPAPVKLHQVILGNLYFLIRSHLEQNGGGQVFLSPLDVLFSIHDVVEPDLLFVSDARADILTYENVQGSPDLLVEILSPSTRRRDEGIKLHLYDANQVMEYWVVDPRNQIVRVYRRVKGRLSMVDELDRESGAVLESSIVPGVSLRLDQIFKK